MLQDMMERKVLKDSLRQSEEAYRLVFEKNPNPAWIHDAETLRILAVNEAAMRKYGYARDEFLGLTLADLRVCDDVPSVLEQVSPPHPEPVNAGVWRHRTKGGAIIDVEILAQEILVEGRAAPLVLAIDVTGRREAEEAIRRSEYLYRTVASNIPSGAVALFDRELRYVVVDGGGVLDAAGASKEALVGKTIPDVHPADAWELLEPLCRAALDGRPASAEVPVRGRIYFVHTLPIPGENGGMPMGMLMALDITARKRAEEEVQRMNENLERRQGRRALESPFSPHVPADRGPGGSFPVCRPARRVDRLPPELLEAVLHQPSGVVAGDHRSVAWVPVLAERRQAARPDIRDAAVV